MSHHITVHEWYGPKEFRTHRVEVFDDDTIMRAVLKIVAALGKKSVPYVWHKRKSLLFTVRSTGWKRFHAHPWEARADGTEVAKPTIVYTFGELIGAETHTLNIAFPDECPFGNNEHFFPSFDQALPTAEAIRREDAILYTLLSYEQKDQIKPYAYSHVVFRGTPYTPSTSDVYLSDLFERLHADKFSPFIQWKDDSVRVLYKLWKHHTIPAAHIAHWTAAERLPKVPTCITAYSPVAGNVFSRVFIALSGEIVVTYHMDIREKVDWKVIVAHKDKVFAWLKTYTGINYSVVESDISVRTEVVTNVSIVELMSVVGNLFPLFHVTMSKAGYLELIYKRSSNYKDNVQLSDYIQSKVNMGIPIPEIVETLVQMGVDRGDVLASLDMPVGEVNAKKIQTGTIIKIGKIGYGLKVNVENCPSNVEVSTALHWLRACILHVPQMIKKPAPAPTKVQKLSSSSSSPAQAPPVELSKKSSQSSVRSEDLDFLSEGGAIGKENQRYFLNMLQEADPALFNNPDINYARTCQASSFHQPVVMSKDEYAKMVDEGFGDAVDNSVTYGSDSSKQNVYFCPRIWCPVSKRPITYDMYVRNGNKCPSGENAKLMYEHPYWNNDPGTKHYIGFHKNKTNNGLCLPCCYVKPLSKDKEKECVAPDSTSKPATPKSPVMKDAYIMTQSAPLPETRSGNIPQVLHEIITPNVNFQLCTKTLGTQACPLRRGILHKNDSLMNALAYAVGKSSKEELIKWIKDELDPLTFLSLENGEIVATFTDVVGPSPREHAGIIKELKVRLRKWEKYRNIFGLDGDKLDKDQYRMSRELQLYMAWLRYIKYLSSDEVKSPHHLYDLMKKLGFLLVVWDKEGSNEVNMRCPMFSSVASLTRAVGQHRHTIMLIHENGVYEPIELKKRTNNGAPVIDTKYITTIDDIMGNCEVAEYSEMTYQRLVAIENWALHILRDGMPFSFDVAVISPDLRISHLLTRGRVLVHIPSGGLPIGILPRLLKDTHTKHVVYHEDIAGKLFTTRLFKADADLYIRKLRSIGFGYTTGVAQHIADAGAPFYTATILTIPGVTTPPTIVVRGNDDLGDFERAETRLEFEWIQLQRMIGKIITQHYDSLVVPILRMTSVRKDRVNILMNTFPAYPDKKRLRAAIEEIPFEQGKENVIRWVRLVGYDTKFPFFDDVVHSAGKDQWMFSQRVVDTGLPNEIVTPVKKNGHRPRQYVRDDTAQSAPFEKPAAKDDGALPTMIVETAVDKKKLPSKWTQIRNYEWAKYNMYVVKSYTRNHVRELFEWLARKVGTPIFWGDIQFMKAKYVTGSLMDENSMLLVLEDPCIAREWSLQFGISSLKTPKQLWERGFSKTGRDQLKAMWDDIMRSNNLWAGDIDFFAAARLIDVTIMVLHRSRYGVKEAKRGDLSDLATSSSLYTRVYTMSHIRNRPICMFYKDNEPDHAVYSAITDQKGVFLFSSLFDCPEDIQKLIEFHITRKTQ